MKVTGEILSIAEIKSKWNINCNFLLQFNRNEKEYSPDVPFTHINTSKITIPSVAFHTSPNGIV